jgi:hypothetical protein
MALFQNTDYGDDQTALLAAMRAYAQTDPTLLAKGMTRAGQGVNLSSALSDAQLQGYYNDPTTKDAAISSALDAELRGGVDLGRYGEGKYLTAKFNDLTDFNQNASGYMRSANTYLSDPTKYTALDSAKAAKFGALPELAALTQVGDMSPFGMNVYDTAALTGALSNYQMFDASKLGDDVFSKKFRERGVDFGDSLALSKSDFDYYKSVADAASAAGLGYYGVNALSDPTSGAAFNWTDPGTPTGSLTMNGVSGRYVPYELLTELNTDTPTGYLGSIRELLGNERIFKEAELMGLSSEQAAQLSKQNWFGTDYAFDRPELGYWINNTLWDEISAQGSSPYLEGGVQGPVASNTYFQRHRYTDPLPTMSSAGDSSVFAGDSIRRMTPEVVNYLVENLKAYGNRAGNYSGGGWTLNPDAGWERGAWADEIRNSKWYSQDAQDPSNFAYDRGNGNWMPTPYVFTPAGQAQLNMERGDVISHYNDFNSNNGGWFDQLVQMAVMTAMTAGMGTALSGAFGSTLGGALSGGLTGAMSGNALTGAITGGIGGALTGGLTDATSYASQLMKDGVGVSDALAAAGRVYELNPASMFALEGAVSGSDLVGGVLSPKAMLSGEMGALKSLLAGGDINAILGQGISGAVGAGAGEAVGDADILGPNSVIDKYAPGLTSSLTKDMLLTGGENSDKILIGAISGAMGSEAGDVVRNVLRPSEETLSSWNEGEESKWLEDAVKWGGDLVASLVKAGVSQAAAEAFADEEVAAQRSIVSSAGTTKTTAAKARAAVAKRRNSAMRKMLAQSSKWVMADQEDMAAALAEEDEAPKKQPGEMDPALEEALAELEAMGVQSADV